MISWSCKIFNTLSPKELYAIWQLRSEVFVVEQNCVFQDADGKDPGAYHLMGWKKGMLAAYARLLAPGVTYDEPCIGRVITSPAVRGEGLGKLLMQHAIIECRKLYGKHEPIRIGAQLYLEKFYSSLGFVTASEMYLEDGIEHIEMLLS